MVKLGRSGGGWAFSYDLPKQNTTPILFIHRPPRGLEGITELNFTMNCYMFPNSCLEREQLDKLSTEQYQRFCQNITYCSKLKILRFDRLSRYDEFIENSGFHLHIGATKLKMLTNAISTLRNTLEEINLNTVRLLSVEDEEFQVLLELLEDLPYLKTLILGDFCYLEQPSYDQKNRLWKILEICKNKKLQILKFEAVDSGIFFKHQFTNHDRNILCNYLRSFSSLRHLYIAYVGINFSNKIDELADNSIPNYHFENFFDALSSHKELQTLEIPYISVNALTNFSYVTLKNFLLKAMSLEYINIGSKSLNQNTITKLQNKVIWQKKLDDKKRFKTLLFCKPRISPDLVNEISRYFGLLTVNDKENESNTSLATPKFKICG